MDDKDFALIRSKGDRALFGCLAPITGKVKGYYVLIRETTSPTWQKKLFTTQNTITIPYSKDNYFMAVQSVNEWGNESLFVIPGVGR